jgi:DNA-binding SARP family transcriptional activator
MDPQQALCLYARAHALLSFGRMSEAIDTLDTLCALPEMARPLRYPLFLMYLRALKPIRAFEVWRQLRE